MGTFNACRDVTCIFQGEKKKLIEFFDRVFQMDTADTTALEAVRVEIRDASNVKIRKKILYDWEFLDNCVSRLRNFPLGWNEQIEEIVKLVSRLIDHLKAFSIGARDSDKRVQKCFKKDTETIRREIIEYIKTYSSECWMMKMSKTERVENDIRNVIEILEQIREELEGETVYKVQRVDLLGRFQSELNNEPYDMGKTKIVLFEKVIDSVARKNGIPTFVLQKIVFVHMFFEAYHAYHYSLVHGTDVLYKTNMENIIVQSLASYAEYLYSSIRVDEEVYWGGGPNWAEKLVNEWKEYNVNWYPYSGAMVLCNKLIGEEFPGATKLFHAEIEKGGRKELQQMGKLISKAYQAMIQLHEAITSEDMREMLTFN